jgi:hypothetical protein
MTKYFEVLGPVRAEVVTMLDKTIEVRRKLSDFAVARGGKGGFFINDNIGTSFGIEDGPKLDKKLWKALGRDKRQFVPRENSKAARAIRDELRKLEQEYPGKMRLAEIIEMEVFREGVWRTPGLIATEDQKRIVVVVDDYTPPKKKAKHIVLRSDLAIERLRQADKIRHSKDLKKPKKKAKAK